MDQAILSLLLPAVRRYEAVVVVGETACSRPATADMLAALCASGAAVAIIGPHRASDVAERFIGFDPGPGALLLAANPDPCCVIIERSGHSVVQREVAADNDRGPMLVGVEDAAAEWVTAELWRRGIGLRDVVVVFDSEATDSGQDDGAASRNDVAIARAGLDDVVGEQRGKRQRGELPWVLPNPAGTSQPTVSTSTGFASTGRCSHWPTG